MRAYEAVLFDKGGTLTFVSVDGRRVPWDRERLALIYQILLRKLEYEVSLEEAGRAQRTFDAAWQERFGDRSRGESWSRQAEIECEIQALKTLGLTDDLDEVSVEFVSLWDQEVVENLFPDVRPCLETLKGLGYRMGVITQHSRPTDFVADLLGKLGILEFFESVISSQSAGLDKPDPRLFELGLEALRIDPEEAVYVGNDYRKDMVGARDAGMTAILLDREREAEVEDCIVINSLADLPEALEPIRG
jgi:HAD superfamily hydrolase (TIGR01549 family)